MASRPQDVRAPAHDLGVGPEEDPRGRDPAPLADHDHDQGLSAGGGPALIEALLPGPGARTHHLRGGVDAGVLRAAVDRLATLGGNLDGVILDHVLDSSRGRAGPGGDPDDRAVIAAARQALSPGGLLIVIARNRWALGRRAEGADPEASGGRSLWGYRRLVRGAGFDRVTAFAVIPDALWPRQLVSCWPPASRVYYRRFGPLERTRHPFPIYLAAATLSRLGLRAAFESTLLITGRR